MNEVSLPSLPMPSGSERGLPGDAVAALVSPLLDPLFLRPQRIGVESAWYGHVPFAHWIAAACAPAVLVELGSHYGVSYFAFCEALARQRVDVRAYAVDTWQGDPHAGHYGDEVFDNVRKFHDERFRGFSTLLRCTFADAVGHFVDGTVDLLHIDGFHTYDAVREDWEAWRPKLSDRAVVLFHDTNVRERDFGVWRLWAELRQSHSGFEFLHSHGLGVLAYGRQAPAAVQALCALSDARAVSAVRERFSLLGERWVEAAERANNIAAQQRAEASLAGNIVDLERTAEERDRLTAESERLAGLLQDVGHQAERADELQRYLDATRDELTRSQTEADVLRRHAATDAVALEQAQQRAAALADAGAERDRLRAELLAVTVDRAREMAELHELRHRHQTVISSAAWRLTAPLHRLETRFPRFSRSTARVLHVGALAATGRLPERLRLRRRVREDAEALRNSPLFDSQAYLARYPDVARSGADPLWHYIWTGAYSGYDPHPLFSSQWYLDQHPGLAEALINPLAHYLREGASLGHDPHPLFDTAFYLAQAADPETSQQPDAAALNPLLHYIDVGACRGHDPNAWFDTDGYWDSYIRHDSPHEPLSHYVLYGAAAGHDPHTLFDTDWYARRYPDSAGWNPLAHFLREGKAQGHAPCLLLTQYDAPPPLLRFTPVAMPHVSIVVPAYGRLFDTLRCLYSVMLHSGDTVTYEVIVADDKPAAPTAPRLRTIPGLRVEQNPVNLGFLRSCNRAAAAAAGTYLLLLNNDTCVHPGWLAPLVQLADHDPRIGIVGVKLVNSDGTLQEAGGTIHSNGWGEPYGREQDPARPEYNFVREVDVVIGACMLVRMSAWEEAGGFDDRFAPAYYEEFDLAFTLRQRGWRVMYQPASEVTHFDASSYGAAERDHQSTINHALFCRKWAEQVAQQPAPDQAPYLARERPPPGGRILFVDDRVPEPDKHAGSVSTLHWLRLLRDAGLRVTFAPHDQDHPQPYTAVLQQMGIEVLYGPTDLPGWLAENGRFLDHVWAARPDVTEPLLDAIGRHAPGRMIYFTHDLHCLREQRRFDLDGDPGALSESRRLRRIEREIFGQSRLVITPSADELPVIQAMAPGVLARAVPLYSVPLTRVVAVTEGAFAGRSDLVFVGGYAHPPNVDAALWLAREIMPLVWQAVPHARLVLVGSKPPDELLAVAGPQIEVTGWLPDLDHVYAGARATVSPLRYGAGVKGKIIAAMQAGVPVITTPIGNEGLGLEPGVEALIGSTATELAQHAVMLLQDPGLCARLAADGMAVLRRHFNENTARRALMDVLGADLCPCCGRRAAASSPVAACDICGADATARALAEVAIRPWRDIAASLRDAAPILAKLRVQVPDGPLSHALGRAGDPANPKLDLLISMQPDADLNRIQPDGRWIYPAPGPGSADPPVAADGWAVRLHEAGPPIIEAENVGKIGIGSTG